MRIPTSTAREARFASYEPLISAAIRFGWLLLCSSRLSSPQRFKVGVDHTQNANGRSRGHRHKHLIFL